MFELGYQMSGTYLSTMNRILAYYYYYLILLYKYMVEVVGVGVWYFVAYTAHVFLLGQFNKFNYSALAPPTVKKKIIRLEWKANLL